MESRTNVSKRIDFIQLDLKRTDDRIESLQKKQDEKRIEMSETQMKMQSHAARLMQSVNS
jgi:peptidoglycan hydrolase CwlO-like protein